MTHCQSLPNSELEELIGTFLQTYPREAVAEVTYCPNKEKAEETAAKYVSRWHLSEKQKKDLWSEKRSQIAVVFCNPYTFGLKIAVPVLVYPPAVGYSQKELVSIIRDHEYVHAQDWVEGMPINSHCKITCEEEKLFSPGTIKLMMEMRAQQHQLDAMPEDWKSKKTSPQHAFYREIIGRYWGYGLALERMERTTTSDYEKMVIGDFLKFLRSKR